MFQDHYAFLAIFDDLPKTRDELKAIESSIAAKAKSVEQSADRIDGAVRQWHAGLKELGTQLGRDVHDNGYAALEKYVDDIQETSISELREIASSAVAEIRQITSTAATEWRALSNNQQETLHRQLKDIAAAANGLPPLPPRPIAASPFGNCAYFAKLTLVRVRRFCIEAKSFATLVLAVASTTAAVALGFDRGAARVRPDFLVILNLPLMHWRSVH
ncbi:hypothetical protein AB4Y32_30625 [Paraburkholderia phymatum]|uniref:Uncharacterized protein n=1 Tax=Paraburkholderia phymatum TaxID=148447 RepID=A0ACC6U900_9BURK